jgi:two-component system, cell cycle response regulator DivK
VAGAEACNSSPPRYNPWQHGVAPAARGGLAGGNGGVARILLVEDDEMIREMVQLTLELYEHEVVCAASGVEALERVGREAPQLILMDVGLPLMDGYEATRRLKSGPATKGVPVIALTAAAGQEDRRKALDAGADEYETKPIDFDRLLSKIDRLLRAKEPGPG